MMRLTYYLNHFGLKRMVNKILLSSLGLSTILPVMTASEVTSADTTSYNIFSPGGSFEYAGLQYQFNSMFSTEQIDNSHWAGYVVVNCFKNPKSVFNYVNGIFLVLTVSTPPNTASSAEWVGIGGLNNGNLIQAGVQSYALNGKPSYRAWYEVITNSNCNPPYYLPAASYSVAPGDAIWISIYTCYYAPNLWIINIGDLGNNGNAVKWSFCEQYCWVVSAGNSAEWIEENGGCINNNLANFNTAEFGPHYVTGMDTAYNLAGETNGNFFKISQLPNICITMKGNFEYSGNAVTSPLSSDGQSFTVKYEG